jgi:beta-1,2-mannobiose phosphorylase / 1,2-beta-oligomannan phosphorylase
VTLNIKKYVSNPILGPNPDRPWGRDEARNPGVVFDGNTFHMTFTSSNKKCNPTDDMTLGYAKSTDGINFAENPDPILPASKNFDDFDYGSTEDSRITEFGGKYYIVYAARSQKTLNFVKGERRLGPNGNRNPTWTENFRRVGLAVTEDWKTIERLGPITSEHICDANVVMFPEKINGKIVMLHRPTPFVPWLLPLTYNPGAIWISFADTMTCCASDKREMPWDMEDGIDIPDDHLLIKPETEWEGFKVGGSGVPIPTDDGWLTFYHAVDRTGVYRVGLMMLDREDPRMVIARSPVPVMEPEFAYETGIPGTGYYANCIFPTANVIVGYDIFIYYGAQDLYCCLATVKLKETIDYIMKFRI